MDEPSVLDYVKSKLAFWRKSSLHLPPPELPADIESSPKAEIGPSAGPILEPPPAPPLVPWLQEEPEAISEPARAPQPEQAVPDTSPRPLDGQSLRAELERRLRPSLPVEAISPQHPVEGALLEQAAPAIYPEPLPEAEPAETPARGPFPWLTLLALVIAVLAQISLEPGTGDRVWKTGVAFYAFVASFLVLAYFRKEWTLPSLLKNADADPLAIKIDRNALVLGIPMALVSFLAFGGGMFTPLNLVLWGVTIFCFIKAFWISPPQSVSWFRRAWQKVTQPNWHISISRWTLLVFAVAAVVIFYRFFRISQVPSDMISDHAEKLLDVYDVLHGKPGVFFPRNTGREFIQFYLTAGIILLLKTGYTYLSLKIGTILCGLLTLPYIYYLGKELGNKRVGLAAAFFAGIAYWSNVIARIGLRFPLYPLFVAPVFYYLLRGIRRRKVNDFILSGIFLGFGLNGYTPVRVLPFVVVAAVFIYLLHRQSRGARKQTIIALLILAVVAMVFIIPLARYAVDDPQIVFYRTLTRIGTEERAFPGPPVQIFFTNLWNSLIMPFWADGTVWVNSIPGRPSLDIITAGLFFIGCVMLLIRYIRQRNWLDLFLLVSIPLLMMSSILSLAFPDENPSLNRSGGAIIPVFLIIAIAFDGILQSVKSRLPGRLGMASVSLIGVLLVSGSLVQNYNLVFDQFGPGYTRSAWNTSEMGGVVKNFVDTFGSPDTAWVVAYPYWVDTRLVAITAGFTTRDLAVWPDGQMPDSPVHLSDTLADPRAKLFLINPQDADAMAQLQKLYPTGVLWLQKSRVEASKDFYVFQVPPAGGGSQ
jgi:4-amino-4-deoxy-L-arabinose transferase-like glycosyltransferase